VVAENFLQGKNVSTRHHKVRCKRVTQNMGVRTKGKKNRSIPISKELYDEIIGLDGFKFFTDS
jgi:hypothetical protein